MRVCSLFPFCTHRHSATSRKQFWWVRERWALNTPTPSKNMYDIFGYPEILGNISVAPFLYAYLFYGFDIAVSLSLTQMHLALYCFANGQLSTALKLLYRARYLMLVVCGEDHPEMALLDVSEPLMLICVGGLMTWCSLMTMQCCCFFFIYLFILKMPNYTSL